MFYVIDIKQLIDIVFKLVSVPLVAFYQNLSLYFASWLILLLRVRNYICLYFIVVIYKISFLNLDFSLVPLL